MNNCFSKSPLTTNPADAGAIPRTVGCLVNGKILILQSRLLWQDLLAHGLVDELHLMILPIMAGAGGRMFGVRPVVALKLLYSPTWQGN